MASFLFSTKAFEKLPFGFETIEVDGHDLLELKNALNRKCEPGKPKAIIASTKKGKGVSIMENKNKWHARRPNKEQWKEISIELGLE